jgi:hypothetical protein
MVTHITMQISHLQSGNTEPSSALTIKQNESGEIINKTGSGRNITHFDAVGMPAVPGVKHERDARSMQAGRLRSQGTTKKYKFK